MNIVYLIGANVVYQALPFTSSDTLDHQIDITILLFYIMEEHLFFLLNIYGFGITTYFIC